MTDKEIRRILIEYLSTTNKTYRIFQEKSIGSSICDIMLVTDKLCGFEIKSDSDNFARIKRQIDAYVAFFDENTLVVGATHVEEAIAKMPTEWGIWCVDKGGVKIIRSATKNNKVEIEQQLSVLWKIELQNILLKHRFPAMRTKLKDEIIKKLIVLPFHVLKKQIVQELLSRDYSVFNADDSTLRSFEERGESGYNDVEMPFENELADYLSERDLTEFTLDRWMKIYRNALELKTQKEKRSIQVRGTVEHRIGYKDIDAYLGVPWVSLDIVKDFLREVFKLSKPDNLIYYEPITGHWSCSLCHLNSKEVNYVYGLPYFNAMRILEATLNLREI